MVYTVYYMNRNWKNERAMFVKKYDELIWSM